MIETSPVDHLHWWEEMMCVADLLPEGNIPMPNAQLQVEWFYKTFHKSDRMEYVQSGRKLSNETLQTVVEYFQLIHETREKDGSLMHRQIKRFGWKQGASYAASWRNNMRIRNAFSPTSVGGHHRRQHGRRKQCKLRDDVSCGDDKRDDRKSPPERKDKDF